MENGSGEDEQMPDGVHIPNFIQRIKEQSSGIAHSADDQKDNTCRIESLDQWKDSRNDAPAAGKVRDHREFFKPFNTDGVENNS